MIIYNNNMWRKSPFEESASTPYKNYYFSAFGNMKKKKNESLG